MLIDRNDELCILYEKANIQESIIRNGEIELRKKEEVWNTPNQPTKQLHNDQQTTNKPTNWPTNYKLLANQLQTTNQPTTNY